MLFDLSRQIHIDTPLEERRGMGSAEKRRVFMVAAGNVDQIHLPVQHLRNLNALVHTDSRIA